MAKYSRDQRLVWLNGKEVSINDAKINILSPTAQFGANVFEGIRCYWNEEEGQLYAFRLKEHYKRLLQSIKLFRFEESYTAEFLEEAMLQIVRANEYTEDIAVRQTVILDGFGTWNSAGPMGMFIAPIDKPRSIIDKNKQTTCCVSSWERIDDRNMPPRIKIGANYINSRWAQMEAKQRGYDMAVFLNRNGKICEGGGSAFFIVRDGVLVTPPFSSSVLESITRDTLITLATEELGLKVQVRDIDRTEAYISDEAFFCGSAVEITPVTEIDGYKLGDGRVGDITLKLHKLYIDAASGKINKYKKWLTPVYEK